MLLLLNDFPFGNPREAILPPLVVLREEVSLRL